MIFLLSLFLCFSFYQPSITNDSFEQSNIALTFYPNYKEINLWPVWKISALAAALSFVTNKKRYILPILALYGLKQLRKTEYVHNGDLADLMVSSSSTSLAEELAAQPVYLRRFSKSWAYSDLNVITKRSY